jgi:hypothetical protein
MDYEKYILPVGGILAGFLVLKNFGLLPSSDYSGVQSGNTSIYDIQPSIQNVETFEHNRPLQLLAPIPWLIAQVGWNG